MGLFTLFQSSFAREAERAKADKNALIIDVRTREEYRDGHLPEAVNIPLDTIANADLPRDKKLFIHCLSGARSRRAAAYLKQQGYDAVDIGGIAGYRGDLKYGD